MKIAHLTSVHPETDVRIFRKECLSLVNAGYDVSLVAAGAKDKVVEGVKIFGVKKIRNRWKRIFFSGKYLYKKAVELDAEIYHFHDPELLPIGIKLKKLGKKVIFDSHEDVPGQILEKEWLPRPFRKSLSLIYAWYESKMLKKLDAVISVTPVLTERLRKINENTFQITNYPIVENDFIDKRKWQRSVCFAGGISQQWLHENVINALENISDITYCIAGVADKDYLDKISLLPGWAKVKFVGKIPFDEVNDFISASSAGMALNDYLPNVGYKSGSLGNTKLFEYMQSGIPVICTDFVLWKEIVEEADCGICVNPHDKEAITRAIRYFTDNPEVAEKMGDNGRKAVENKYNWHSQEIILLNLYRRLFEKQRM
jgi:glycosyltransferase involved in cell wall biosynthesis